MQTCPPPTPGFSDLPAGHRSSSSASVHAEAGRIGLAEMSSPSKTKLTFLSVQVTRGHFPKCFRFLFFQIGHSLFHYQILFRRSWKFSSKCRYGGSKLNWVCDQQLMGIIGLTDLPKKWLCSYTPCPPASSNHPENVCLKHNRNFCILIYGFSEKRTEKEIQRQSITTSPLRFETNDSSAEDYTKTKNKLSSGIYIIQS